MVGKNEQASSAKFFSGTTRRATEGSPQRDKAVAGRLRKAVEQKELPRRVAEEEKVGSLFAVGPLPRARTHARLRARARYAISPGNSCFLFVENFPFSARRIYTPFIDRQLEKDYNEGW